MKKKRKSKRKQRLLSILIIFICIIVFVVSGFKLIIHNSYEKKSENFNEELNSEFVTPEVETTNKPVAEETDDEDEAEDDEIGDEYVPNSAKGISVNFKSLIKKNKSVKAWLYCQNTNISYPVVLSSDNEDYVHTLLNGDKNFAGTLFTDCRNTGDFSDWNTVIYGHNMKNGTMFGNLTRYKSQAYYNEHPVMKLYTPDCNYYIEIFASLVTDCNSKYYNLPNTEEEKNAIVEKAKGNSYISASVKVGKEDKIVTLSTCPNSYGDKRFIVLGKLTKV